MQYHRRRIQRVSGVTIRDERVESQDFSVQPRWESWDDLGTERREHATSNRDTRTFNKQGMTFRERT